MPAARVLHVATCRATPATAEPYRPGNRRDEWGIVHDCLPAFPPPHTIVVAADEPTAPHAYAPSMLHPWGEPSALCRTCHEPEAAHH